MEDCKKIMDENINSIINYSIIIPHKNIPDLLQRCLNSIPRRDDIQIIVVDDNSDPAKVDFNKFPGVGEKCVEVYFTKEGKGAGYARNVGLKHAVGKWLLFADADDFYTIEFLPIVDEYKDSDKDIIFFNANSVFSDDLNKISNRSKPLSNLLFNAQSTNDYDILRYLSYFPCAKIIKNTLIKQNKIVFDETCLSNDMLFSIKSGYYASQIDTSNSRIYTITEQKGSLSHTLSSKGLIARYTVAIGCNRFLYKIHKEKYRLNLYEYAIQFWRVSKKNFVKYLILASIDTPIKYTFKDIISVLKKRYNNIKQGTFLKDISKDVKIEKD